MLKLNNEGIYQTFGKAALICTFIFSASAEADHRALEGSGGGGPSEAVYALTEQGIRNEAETGDKSWIDKVERFQKIEQGIKDAGADGILTMGQRRP